MNRVKDKDSNNVERSCIAFLFFIFRFIASKLKGLDIDKDTYTKFFRPFVYYFNPKK